jgi:Cu-Zn family superoxide dismutase
VLIRSRLTAVYAVVCALACSGRLEAPEGSGQGGGGSAGLAPARPVTAAGNPGVGGQNAGAAGSGASAHIAEDPGDLPIGGADVEVFADAQLMPTQGNGVTGSVHFAQLGRSVAMTVTLSGCPMGPHALHLHANAACGDNANAAGGHWQPQGDGIGDVSCGADGSAQHGFTPPEGTWSIGGPASSNVLRHALVLHEAANLPDPGGRIACGIPAKVE